MESMNPFLKLGDAAGGALPERTFFFLGHGFELDPVIAGIWRPMVVLTIPNRTRDAVREGGTRLAIVEVAVPAPEAGRTRVSATPFDQVHHQRLTSTHR
jgi:hypothetical protein